jgi:hypothetical protein
VENSDRTEVKTVVGMMMENDINESLPRIYRY